MGQDRAQGSQEDRCHGAGPTPSLKHGGLSGRRLHLTSEQPIAVTARGRTVDEWKLLPGRENHFLDCAVLATVAASAAGITAVGAEMAPERQRRRVEVPKPGAQRKTIATRRR